MKNFDPFNKFHLWDWFDDMMERYLLKDKYPVQDLIGKTAVHTSKRYQVRAPSAINAVVIHHSATEKGNAHSFARYQVWKNGFPGIGYHCVILPDGTRQMTNHITTKSWHAGSRLVQGDENLYTLGLCLVGDFTEDRKPTIEQYESAAVQIWEWQRELRRTLKVGPHSQFKDTNCPGDNVDFKFLESLI
jgi:N-acetylmuramoyl-L-alanine amidase